MVKMEGIVKELLMTVIVILCSFVKLSIEQTRTAMIRPFPTENNTNLRANTSQVEHGINIGESFFLDRLRQGDSEAITRLGQFQQTVDTPMTLLHNFFQVFSRPDLRQRSGVFGLLHNLAVARGLLPNSLAVGTDGLPIQDSTQQVSTIVSGNSIQETTEIPLTRNGQRFNFQINNRNIPTNENRQITINGNTNRLSNNIIGSSAETNSEEIIDPFILRTDRRPLSNALPSTVTRNSTPNKTNVTFPNNSGRVFNANINQRTSDLDRIDVEQRQVIQRDRNTLDRGNLENVVTNTIDNNSNVPSTTIIPVRKFLTGGRFSSPSLQVKEQFQKDSFEQRGARIFSDDLQSRLDNRNNHSIIQDNKSTMSDNRKQSTLPIRNVQQNDGARLKRPSKLNFMLEMPLGVHIRGRIGTVKPNDIGSTNQFTDSRHLQQNSIDTITMTGNELESHQKLDESQTSQTKMKLNVGENDLLSNMTDTFVDEHNISSITLPNANTNSSIETDKNYILQRVGHIQLDPTDHVLQVVGEMNLSLAEPEFNLQRVGELNIGRRRQFIMDVRVNSSSDEDKVLLQRVGLTDVVPGEKLQLHGTGDVRLLTKERVIIQRLGFISFQTDTLKVNGENENQQQNRTDTVRTVFTIEPIVNTTLKPNLLFLGRETGTIMSENSNDTVLQFVGDVLSEMPQDVLNITAHNIPGSAQNMVNSTNVVTINTSDRDFVNNRTITTSVRKGITTARERINEIISPVLRENVSLKSKQDLIGILNNPPINIHLKPIGRIFSTVELKYEDKRPN